VQVLADSRPVPKDVVIGTLGASAALAGLVLVFIGLLRPAFRETWATGPKSAATVEQWKKALDGLRLALQIAIFAIPLVFASVGLSLAWLAIPGGHELYVVNIWLFVAALLAVFGVAVAGLIGLLRAGVPEEAPP
jgi:hypothetical protein